MSLGFGSELLLKGFFSVFDSPKTFIVLIKISFLTLFFIQASTSFLVPLKLIFMQLRLFITLSFFSYLYDEHNQRSGQQYQYFLKHYPILY